MTARIFSIVSPLLFLIIVPIGLDITSSFFIFSLLICVLVGSIFFAIHFIKLAGALTKKNGLAKTHLTKLVQPTLLLLILLSVFKLNELALGETDKFAIAMGQKVQQICILKQKCPDTIEGWKNGVIYQYSSWGSKKQLQYWPYDKTFILTVHHDIDTPYKVEGGVNKPFKYGFR